ncbi:SRPBCC family protein [Flavobacterium sp. C4GT6]|uniref:SRPBCC family protein n=1 Tax=Flavobacterium sp. C4GT6 TaxID=3103818 RepID=UPI002ED6B268
MKIIKRILIVLLVIIAIPFILAIFINKEYRVERQITINKPQAEVFDYVSHLKNMDEYSVWMKDPNMKTKFTGYDGYKGFIYGWDGNEDVGEGELEITDIKINEHLDMDLRFIRPFESEAKVYMTTENSGNNSTDVHWVMQGTNSYPMNFMNLMMDNMIGKDLDANLQNIKSNLEKQ